MRTWWPRKERAGTPTCWRARAASAAVTCSPVETRASLSRSSGVGAMARARPRSRFVSPAMALTTTTTWFPRARLAATRSATWRMRSTSATEVPPNFCTTSAIGRLVLGIPHRRAAPQVAHGDRQPGGSTFVAGAPLPRVAEPPDADVGPQPAGVPADLLVHDVGLLGEPDEEGRVALHRAGEEARVLRHVREGAVEVGVEDDVLHAGAAEAVDELGAVDRIPLRTEADAGGQAVEPRADFPEPLEAEREPVEIVGEERPQEDDRARRDVRAHPLADAGVRRRLP